MVPFPCLLHIKIAIILGRHKRGESFVPLGFLILADVAAAVGLSRI